MMLAQQQKEEINKSILSYHKIFGGITMEVNYLSSGNELLDSMLNGGYREGTLCEISGITDSGKTLLALKAIKQAQLKNKLAVYINTSNDLNESMLKDNDIDIGLLIVLNINTADTLGPIISDLKPYIDDIGIIVVGNLASLTTSKEQDSPLKANTDIHRSKVIKSLLTRISNIIRGTNTCSLIINQERTNFVDNEAQGTVSSSEKWINMTCDTRIKLTIDDEGDSCVEVKFKERKL